jgi:hypothetical protein
MKRWMWGLLSLAVLAFGLATLNYTKESTYAGHTAWAVRRGMPEPSEGLFRIGTAFTVVGSLMLGLTLRAKRN